LRLHALKFRVNTLVLILHYEINDRHLK